MKFIVVFYDFLVMNNFEISLIINFEVAIRYKCLLIKLQKYISII
jgi:hypothetical protein